MFSLTFYKMYLPRAVLLQPEKPRPIFIGGIHGVGKSTVASKVCTELNFPHLTASEVIHKFKEKKLIESVDEGKLSNDINLNQDVLISALNHMVINNTNYILDGHFTLFDSEGTIQQVPTSTFSVINPIGLFVIIDKPESIRSRLLLRDKKTYCKIKLEEMQNAELDHASNVAKYLGVDLHEISPISGHIIKEYIIDLNKDKILKGLDNRAPTTWQL